jgi:hypothetical protein
MKNKLLNLLNKLNSPKPERVYEQKVYFVPRSRAYLCENCDAIGGSAKRCPRCDSVALLHLSKFIQEHKDTIKLVSHKSNENSRSRTLV